MNKRLAVSLMIVYFLVSACQTTSDAKTSQDVVRSDNGRSDADAGPLKEMQSYFENAGKKMDEMAVSEAVNQYIAVLSIKKSLNAPADEINALAAKAQTELTKIEAGFLMQAGSEWLDSDSNQIAASTYAVGKSGALHPKILLWYNVGGSRIAVSAAPVLFEFVKGTGLLTGFASTNEYGEASVPLAKIDNPNKETVVRATVSFTVKGYNYRFGETKLEFIYLPPSKRATILTYERGPDYVAEDPYVFNVVFEALKKMEFDFIPFNGKLLGNDFMNVFGGDLKSIKSISLEQNVPYLVTVLNDCYSVRRVGELSVFLGEGKSTLRIVRVADGKILFETVGYADKAHDTHGQGSSKEKTIRDVIVRSAKELDKNLGQKMKEINQALGIE